MMNFERWLSEGRLRNHKTNKEEIQALLGLAKRDLEDASIQSLSKDRRFLIAYDAALTLAAVPLYCAGYKTYGVGHHWMTFRILPDCIGKEHTELADYFDLCRTKRNVSAYDRGGQISENEVEEIIEEVTKFVAIVKEWLERNHPEYMWILVFQSKRRETRERSIHLRSSNWALSS
jgi:hypothetical protein